MDPALSLSPLARTCELSPAASLAGSSTRMATPPPALAARAKEGAIEPYNPLRWCSDRCTQISRRSNYRLAPPPIPSPHPSNGTRKDDDDDDDDYTLYLLMHINYQYNNRFHTAPVRYDQGSHRSPRQTPHFAPPLASASEIIRASTNAYPPLYLNSRITPPSIQYVFRV